MINSKKFYALCLILVTVGFSSGCSKTITTAFTAGLEGGIGNHLVKKGKYQESIAHFNKSISSYPLATSYAGLGMAYEKLGNDSEALKNFNKAIDQFDAPINKAITKRRRFSESPTLGGIYSLAASIYLRQKNTGLAQSYIKKAIELEPAVAQNFCMQAQIEHAVSNDKEAIIDATKAIDLDPHNSQAYSIRGLCELDTGKYKQSIADCDAVVGIDSDNKEAKTIRSKALAHIGKQAVH